LLDIYWNILTMHVPINVKSPNNISEWQMGFNSAFKGLIPRNITPAIYSRVSSCDGSFYDDSRLRPLSSRTEHSRLVLHHFRNSSVFSLLSAILALFRCARVSSFSILVQFF